MSGATAGIDVRDGCDSQSIPADVFTSDVPVLLKGLVQDWPAVAACSPSMEDAARYLSRFWIDQPVTAYVGEPDIDGRFFYSEDFSGFNFQVASAPLAHVLQKLIEERDSPERRSIYVGSTPVDRWLPGFRAVNDLSLPNQNSLVSFWLGAETRVSAHYDFPDNIACVVAGRRKFTLFPPEQVRNLYVGPLDKTPSGQAISLVDFSAPDFERFPRFREALDAALVFDLAPGDAIFIPSMWWHHVESKEPFNLLVNYWWVDAPAVLGSPTIALMNAILSVRDLPKRQRDAWRALFDHYVFDADETTYEHIPEAGRGCLAPLTDTAARKLRAELINRLNQ